MATMKTAGASQAKVSKSAAAVKSNGMGDGRVVHAGQPTTSGSFGKKGK